MQHTFHISTKLKITYEEQTILNFLTRGSDIGFMYFDNLSKKPEDKLIPHAKLISLISEHKYPFIETRFEDTFFKLYFYQEPDKNMSVSFWYAGGHSWKQEFSEGNEMVDFDLPRYTRLMAQLIEGFEVIKFEAKIEDE